MWSPTPRRASRALDGRSRTRLSGSHDAPLRRLPRALFLLANRIGAAALSVSPATAHRWWYRWHEGKRRPQSLCSTAPAVRSACRGCSPSSCRSGCATAEQDPLGAAPDRRGERLCPLDRLEGAPSTRPLTPSAVAEEPANSYEWPCPGDLLHMDVSRYVCFERPGHRVTGGRSQRSQREDASRDAGGLRPRFSRITLT